MSISDHLGTAMKMIQTPEVLVQIGKSVVRKRTGAPFDYQFRNGQSGPFSSVNIKIINACNLRCKMCGQWGETGWHFAQGSSFLKELVPLETYRKLVDDVAHLQPWFSIAGGEPFLYPDLLPLLTYVKNRGLAATLSTNGLTLAKHAEELVDIGLDFLYVSIDGDRECHDRIRCLEGAFDKSTDGIRAIQAHKKKRRSLKPYLVVAAAISKDNAAILDRVFEAAEDVDADCVVAAYGWFQTESSCRDHERVMSEKLDTMPVSQRGWLWSYQQIDTNALVETVRRIKNRRWKFSYSFMPELTLEEIPQYYTEHTNTFGHNRCLFPWTVVEILANGNVTTCTPYPDYICGNIKENSIIDIWNNERYRRFRTVLKEEGLLPVCSRCCGLLSGGRVG